MLNVYTFYDDKDMDSPVRRKCIESWSKHIPDAKITVLDHSFLNDVPKEFWSPHYQFCKDYGMNRRYLSDSVRLKMSQAIDNFIYIDSDTFIYKDMDPKYLGESGCSAYYCSDNAINMGGFFYNKDKNDEIQRMIDWYDNPANFRNPLLFLKMTDVVVANECKCKIEPCYKQWFTHFGIGFMQEYTKNKKVKILSFQDYKNLVMSSMTDIANDHETIYIALRLDIPKNAIFHPDIPEVWDSGSYWPVASIFPLYKGIDEDLTYELRKK